MALFKTPIAKPVEGASDRQQGALFSIRKADQEQQVVFGEVYAPGFPDSQGDYMDAEAIRKMAYDFMKKSALDAIDVQHDQQNCGAYVVESFIAGDDQATFIPGSWVIGVHIPDPQLWTLVKKGELNGFSLDGKGVRTSKPFVVDLPETLQGETDEVNGHKHRFDVKINAAGQIYGQTDVVNGHSHFIRHGTHTDVSAGHQHRFSFVEGVLAHGKAGPTGN